MSGTVRIFESASHLSNESELLSMGDYLLLITSAKGLHGCAKSASECTGWDFGGDEGVGGRAELPDTNESLGFGPRIEDVICVAMGLRKKSRSKYFLERGGSCCIFLRLVSA